MGEGEPENGGSLTGTDLPVGETSPVSIQRIQIFLHYQLQEKIKEVQKEIIKQHSTSNYIECSLKSSCPIPWLKRSVFLEGKRKMFTLTYILPPPLPFSYLV